MRSDFITQTWCGENISLYAKTRESLGDLLRDMEFIIPIYVSPKHSKSGRGKNLDANGMYSMSVWKNIYVDLSLDSAILSPLIYGRCETIEEVEKVFRHRLDLLYPKIVSLYLSLSENESLRGERLRTMSDTVESNSFSQSLFNVFAKNVLEYNNKSFFFRKIKAKAHQDVLV